MTNLANGLFVISCCVLVIFSLYLVIFKRAVTEAIGAGVLACLFLAIAHFDQVRSFGLGGMKMELDAKIQAAVQSLDVYNVDETATVAADRATPFTVRCRNVPTDIALSYSFSRIENPNLGPVTIREAKPVRDEKTQRQIGFALTIYNGAGQERPAGQVQVSISCLSLGTAPKSP